MNYFKEEFGDISLLDVDKVELDNDKGYDKIEYPSCPIPLYPHPITIYLQILL